MSDQKSDPVPAPVDGANDETADDWTYLVVVNDEEQYSIWLSDQPVPAGWYREGTSGSKEQCLDHIEAIWTDMRPLSVRKRLAAA
ncbi:MbtH family protein [Microlunatus soli]|uniref:MbtH protein n=1 Tax=Microlunatus soli TaxID=630515 RepID=A0A1H1VSK5_9ACTN|nr:MbtH family NRPS accessory protein [Microlunatus soli]SDS87948.1 MbtH protein [Microlunatus soli]